MPIANNTFRGVYTPPAKVMPKGKLNDMLTDPANKVTGDNMPRLAQTQNEAPSASPLPLIIPGLMVVCLICSWILFSVKPSFAFSIATNTPASEVAALAAPTNPPQKRMDIIAPSATIEPTITPTAGPDYAATRITQDTEQRRIDLANQAIDLQNAKTEAEKKAALAQIEIDEANKKAEIEIQAAKDKVNAEIAANNEIIGNEIKAVSDEIAAKKRKAEMDYTVSIILAALGSIALVVVILVSIVIGRQQYAKILEERAAIKAMRENRSAPAIPFVPAPPDKPQGKVAVTLDRRETSGMGAVDFTTCPIGKDILVRVAELIILEHRHYSENQMTGALNPLTKDGTFDTFGKWMIENRIAAKNDKNVYSIQDIQFFEKLVN